MLKKVCGIARILAVLLSVVAAFVALGTLDTALVLLVLGIVAGICMPAEDIMRQGILVLVLPVVGAALGGIPTIGDQLGAVAGNLAVAVAGSLAAAISIRVFNVVKGDITGLGAS